MGDKRNLSIDAIRGLAIILVVAGHTMVFSDPDFGKNTVLTMIYTFHVPLFFFISGYILFGRLENANLSWAYRKFTGLIIPYLIFSFVYFFILPGFSFANFTVQNIINDIFAYAIPNSAWFLPVLFECLIVLALVIKMEKYVDKKILIPLFIVLSLVIFPLTSLYYVNALRQVVFYSTFVVAGYYVSGYRDIFYSAIKNDMIDYSLIGLLIFPAVYSLRDNTFFNTAYGNVMKVLSIDWQSNYFFSSLEQLLAYYYYYLIIFSGILMSFVTVRIISKFKLLDGLVTCGVFSMEIYLIHLILLAFSSRLPFWFGSGWIRTLSGTSIILAVSLCIAYILAYNETIGKILFGRWSFKHLTVNWFKIFYLLGFVIVYLYIINATGIRL